MAAFAQISWGEPDAWAIVVGRGVAAVEAATVPQFEAWLDASNYKLVEFDFGDGISPVVERLGQYFNWQEQFGYSLDPHSRNLDALADGFDIDVPNIAFKLSNFDVALSENKTWCHGLLSIVSEHSIRQLALGLRFFAVLPVPDAESPLVGESFEELRVPFPFRFRGAAA